MSNGAPTRVVILGGGFAGVTMAMELGRLARGDRDVNVHLVSNENYFVFQPLLPEVVACRIEPSHIINPVRQLCRNAHVTRAAIREVDLTARRVRLVDSDAKRELDVDYDMLVVALGVTMDLSRIPGMREHALPIKNLGDAFHLRNHVLRKLEEADHELDEERRRRMLTFVAVGGGFSGVETVAELNDMVKGVLRYYRRARDTGHRMVLVHSRDRILNELEPGLAEFAQRKLQQRGVELVLGTHVAECTGGGVVLTNGAEIVSDTVVCTVGNSPHPVITGTRFPQERGRILVDECLRVKGLPGVWALGDCAMVPDVKRGGFCPPTAQYALRQGKQCARNVYAAIRGGHARPFVFAGLGQLAVVGHRCGVAQLPAGIKISGLLAWVLWRSVYWWKLPGARAKMRVGIDWALDLFFPRDIAMLDVQRTELLGRAHYKKGEVMVRQGEIGDRFYVIERGEVEVVRENNGREEVLAQRTAGESFGEIALMRNTPRTATVRCLTPVDVISFSREDFRALVGSSETFRALFEGQVRAMEPDSSHTPAATPEADSTQP